MLFLVIRLPGTAPINGAPINAAIFTQSDIFKNYFTNIPNPAINFQAVSGSARLCKFFCFDKNDRLRNAENNKQLILPEVLSD